MTSFIIQAHTNRPKSSWMKKSPYDYCTFCAIINDEQPAFRVYETDNVIAILDIMPLRRGHVLVIPKKHYQRVSELPSEDAAAVGVAVSKVAHALTEALENTALNIVCNQEYAQAVPHVHYHIIPAPNFSNSSRPPSPSTSATSTEVLLEEKVADVYAGEPPLTRRQMHQREYMSREELDEKEAEPLLKLIRAKL